MRSKATSSVRWTEVLGGLCGVTLAATAPSMASPASLPPLNQPAAGAVDHEGPEAALFASPTTRDHIGRVVVPVMINGQGPFRFIVDTGANRSTISPQLASALGLKPTDESTMTVNGITGTAQASFVTVDRLQAGDLTIDGTVLPVVWAPVMAGADGILGAAGLKEKSLFIDFQRNRVEIAHHVATFGGSGSIRIHALPPTHGLVSVEAKVGRVRVTAIIDTGSERTLGNLALRDALKNHRPLGFVAQLTSVYGATQEIETGEIARAPPITIEQLHISDVAIVYGDFHVFKVWGLTNSPALIVGMDVLGTVASLSIDFKYQNIYVTSVRERSAIEAMRGTLADSTQKK